jgi:pSer/pThr/pTyr-binding forkhead associated (FHA) protein
MADGCTFTLSAPVVIVGRVAGCDVVIPNDTISSHHAEITNDGVAYTLRDLGSRNGTWINGRKIVVPCSLNPGDQVAFGQVICVFQGPSSGTRAISEAQLATRIGPQAAGLPVSRAGPSPLLAPPSDDVGALLRSWDNPPQVEGRIVDVTATTTEKKDGMGGKVAAAVGLAIIAAPLAWIPFAMDRNEVPVRFMRIQDAAMDRNEVPVRFMRIQDAHTGRQVSVKMIGDPSGAIAVGDVVAVWGVQSQGDLVMQAAYNYTTGAQIRLKI